MPPVLLITERVRRILAASSVPMTASEITSALDDRASSVGGALGRLHRMGVIKRARIDRPGFPYRGIWAYSIVEESPEERHV